MKRRDYIILSCLLLGMILLPVLWAGSIDWIQYNERVVGDNSPLYDDVVNRPSKQIWSAYTTQHNEDGTHIPEYLRPLIINDAVTNTDTAWSGSKTSTTTNTVQSNLNTHIGNSTIHYTQSAINHDVLQGASGYTTHAGIDTHISNAAIHYAQAAIDHSVLQGAAGYANHSTIDAHMADPDLHYAQSAINHDVLQGAAGYASHSTIDTHLTTAAGYFGAIDGHVADNSIHAPIVDTLSTSAGTLWSSVFTSGEIDGRISAAVISAGAGDMPKSVYDTDNNGVVDAVDGTFADMFKSVYDTNDNGIVDAVDNAAPALSVTDDTTTVNAVDLLRFNPASGFSVTNDGNGDVTIDLGSAWNPIQVSGQSDLDATGEQALELVAGDNITLTTNPTASPPSLTITSTASGGGGIEFEEMPTWTAHNAWAGYTPDAQAGDTALRMSFAGGGRLSQSVASLDFSNNTTLSWMAKGAPYAISLTDGDLSGQTVFDVTSYYIGITSWNYVVRTPWIAPENNDWVRFRIKGYNVAGTHYFYNPAICVQDVSGNPRDCVVGTWTAMAFNGSTSVNLSSSNETIYTDWIYYPVEAGTAYHVEIQAGNGGGQATGVGFTQYYRTVALTPGTEVWPSDGNSKTHTNCFYVDIIQIGTSAVSTLGFAGSDAWENQSIELSGIPDANIDNIIAIDIIADSGEGLIDNLALDGVTLYDFEGGTTGAKLGTLSIDGDLYPWEPQKQFALISGDNIQITHSGTGYPDAFTITNSIDVVGSAPPPGDSGKFYILDGSPQQLRFVFPNTSSILIGEN